MNALKYPKLAALMAVVPDYRGVFLRGHGSTNSFHFRVVNHQSGNLGELQGDSVRNITGTFKSFDRGGDSFTGVFTKDHRENAALRAGAGDDWAIIYKFDMALETPIDNEIRPINRAVKWIIKAA